MNAIAANLYSKIASNRARLRLQRIGCPYQLPRCFHRGGTLPHHSNYETCQELKTASALPHLPTGPEVIYETRSLKNGFDERS